MVTNPSGLDAAQLRAYFALMDVAGLPTSHGSRIYAGRVAADDSVIASRLREAGVVFVGKTNTPEFGAGSHTFNARIAASASSFPAASSRAGSSAESSTQSTSEVGV